MNKIIVNDDLVELQTSSSLNIDVYERQDIFDVTKLKIQVLRSTSLIIEYNNQGKSKIDIEININKGVKFKLIEIKEGYEIKVQYKYNLDDYSEILVNKFYDLDIIKEFDVINLNGKNSTINYNLNSIAKNKQSIDILVCHNNEKTTSNINNKAICILEGSVKFNITCTGYDNIKKYNTNHNNQIINLNDKKCLINPSLLSDDNVIETNHTEYIGKFNDVDLSYLLKEGINKENALKMHIKNFFKFNINNSKINKIINKYWR